MVLWKLLVKVLCDMLVCCVSDFSVYFLVGVLCMVISVWCRCGWVMLVSRLMCS